MPPYEIQADTADALRTKLADRYGSIAVGAKLVWERCEEPNEKRALLAKYETYREIYEYLYRLQVTSERF